MTRAARQTAGPVARTRTNRDLCFASPHAHHPCVSLRSCRLLAQLDDARVMVLLTQA